MGFKLGDIGDFFKGGSEVESKSTSESETTESGSTATSNQLTPEMQALFAKFFPQAGDFVDSGTEGIFQGDRLGEQDALVEQGQTSLLDAAGQFGEDNRAVSDSILAQISNDPNDPLNLAMIDALGTNVSDQFNRKILPGISQNSTAGGQFGASRQGIAQGVAGGEAAKAIAQGTVSILDTQRDRSLRAASAAPGILQGNLLPAEIEQQVGDQRTIRTQQELDDEIQAFEGARRAGFRSLTEFQSVLNNNPLLAGIGTSTSDVSGTSTSKGSGTGTQATEGSVIQGLTGLIAAGAGVVK